MALVEVDAVLRVLQSPRPPPRAAISVLFLPTGPLQETALRSGWGDDFVALARRCDAALAKACATAAR
ncbi:MAG: hypothetical protein KY467_03425 [Gemmatimonadetes bacterium]|nr:hypothetical protein [Gemmatimonadota bacterium]